MKSQSGATLERYNWGGGRILIYPGSARANNTDEDPSLRIESFAIINLRDVSTKLNKYIVFTMQTYKELITEITR